MDKTGRKPNKPLYIALSIIIACTLWFYVRSVDDQDRTNTISNIPVTFVGEDVLNSNGLMMVGDQKETVSLTVQGRWNVISQLRRDNIGIQVDLSRIVAEGEYSRAYDIIWPSTVSTNSFSLVGREPFYVPVTVAKQTTQTVEVRGVFRGNVADGFQAGEFSFQPATVEVSGSEADAAQVAYAQVTLNREDLSETVREDMPYVLIGQDGQVIENTNLKSTPETVNVTLPVVMVKEVPLTVDFTPGGGLTGGEDSHVKWSIEPKTVMLSGSEADLAMYSSINLGSVDLAKVISSENFTFPIPVGQEVVNISGVQEATVTVSVQGLSTANFTTDNIELVNPNNVDAELITRSLTIQVRGSEDALAQILPQYIRVVVDLSDLSAIPDGQSLVPAKVSLVGVADAGVIGEYKAAVLIGSGAAQVGGHP